MTIDEFFEAIKQAKPEDREKLADQLLPRLSEDERILAGSTVGEFITVLNGPQTLNASDLPDIEWE